MVGEGGGDECICIDYYKKKTELEDYIIYSILTTKTLRFFSALTNDNFKRER